MLRGVTLFSPLLLLGGASQVMAAYPPGAIVDVQNIPDVVDNILCPIAGIIFWILMTLSVYFVLYSAFQFLTSGGDEKKTREAGKTITYAAIAIVVALLAQGFPLVIAGIFPGAGRLETC